jgi:hypothetical protein
MTCTKRPCDPFENTIIGAHDQDGIFANVANKRKTQWMRNSLIGKTFFRLRGEACAPWIYSELVVDMSGMFARKPLLL